MKKLTSILLITIMLLISFSSIINAVGDITAPSIISVEKDKESLKPGETITFTVKVDDDYSGAEGFMVEWYLNGDSTRNLSNQFDNITKKIDNYEFTIPNNALAGNYQVAYVTIYDNAQNYKRYNRSEDEELLSKFDFTVEETDQDIVPPVVSNFKVITKNVSAPGTIKVQYDVIDAESGVKENTGGVIVSPISDLSKENICPNTKIDENTYQSYIYRK